MYRGYAFRYIQYQFVLTQVEELGYWEDVGYKVVILVSGSEFQVSFSVIDFQGNLCGIGKGMGQRIRVLELKRGKVKGF